jgi:hypothetical protein
MTTSSGGELADDPRWHAQATRRRRTPHCTHCVGPPKEAGERPACRICGAVTCAQCATPCRGCAVLARLRAVCAGDLSREPSLPGNAGERKVFGIIRTFGDARDVLLSGAGIYLRAIGDRRRHTYFASAAPYVLRQVLNETGVVRLDQPLVAGTVRAAQPTLFASRPELVWLIPVDRGVELRFRPQPPATTFPESPRAIPSEGPYVLPPPWRQPEPEFGKDSRVDGRGVACPHCGRESDDYRAIEAKAVVCARCGRSFVHPVLMDRIQAATGTPARTRRRPAPEESGT